MNRFAIILIILLFIAVILLGADYYVSQREVAKFISINQENGKIVAFDNLFIQKVLRAQGVVSVDDRLALEKAVTDTKDAQLLNQWHSFLASTTQQEAQTGVLDLLSMINEKIIY